MQSVETGKHSAAPALQALRTPSTLPSRRAEPALSVPGWGQYPNEKDGATGQREGGSEAEGKSQRRQTSKGLTSRLLRGSIFKYATGKETDSCSCLEWSHPLIYRSKDRIVMEPTQGDTVTTGMMGQQALEADPNYAHKERKPPPNIKPTQKP